MTTVPHGVALAFAIFGACAEPQPVPGPPREIETVAPTPAPDVAPEVVKATPPPTPVVVREAGRTVVSAAAPIEDLVALRSGFAWIEDGSVRVLTDAEEAPRVLATIVDPHGLASNGDRVCWLGDEKNGCHDLAKDVAIALPRVGGPGDQEALAFGDVLYARSRPDAVWRFDGERVVRLPFHPDPTWKLMPGLGAGSKVAILPAIDPKAGKSWLVRVPARGKVSTIAVPTPPRASQWAVDTRGVIAFVDGGEVKIADPGKTTPRTFAQQVDVQQLCWCGPEVCTIARGVLRRHPARGEPASLATDVGDVARLSCGYGRIAWSERTGDTVKQIVAIAAP